MAGRKKKRKVSYEMPTLGFHVPEGSDLEKKINSKAKRIHDGKVSAYVRKCVEKDLEGSYEVTGNTSLIDLARQFRPALVPRIERYNLEEQSLILDRLLEAFTDALGRNDFDPAKRFYLSSVPENIMADTIERFEKIVAHADKSARIFKFISDKHPELREEAQALLAAEDAGKYTANHEEALKKLSQATAASHTPPPTPPKQKPPGSA